MKRILTLAAMALFALTAAAQPDTPVVKYLKGDIRRAAFNTHSYEFEPVKGFLHQSLRTSRLPFGLGWSPVQTGPRPPHQGQ